MILNKIIGIIISEFAEGLIFYLCLIFFNGTPILSSHAWIVYLIWGISGIATPIVIWFELWKQIKKHGI